MSMTDPLADLLTRIRNGQRAHKETIIAPASKLRTNVLEVLKNEGYIRGYSEYEVRPGISEIKIELKYHEGDPVIRGNQPDLDAGPPRLLEDQGPAPNLQTALEYPSCRRPGGVDVGQRSPRRQRRGRSALPGFLSELGEVMLCRV